MLFSIKSSQTLIKVLGIIIVLINVAVGVKIGNFKEFSGVDDDELDDYALDLAVKLKKEFSDDPVSDLFATSYGLEKIARVFFLKLF